MAKDPFITTGELAAEDLRADIRAEAQQPEALNRDAIWAKDETGERWTPDEVFEWLEAGKNALADRIAGPMTLEDFEAHPMLAVNLDLPGDASPEFLAAVHEVALGCGEMTFMAMLDVREGAAFAHWVEDGPDAHEYFEQDYLNALDRIEAIETLRPELAARRDATTLDDGAYVYASRAEFAPSDEAQTGGLLVDFVERPARESVTGENATPSRDRSGRDL